MEQIPDGERIEFENAFYADEGHWIESLLVTARSPFDPEAVVGQLSRAELFHYERVSDRSVDHVSYRLTVVAQEPYPFLLGVILRGTAIPNRLQLHDGTFEGVVTVKEWETFRELAERIEEQFRQFELLSVNQVETTGEPFGSGQLGRVLRNELSQEQLTVLQTAHRLGYFDVPRQASAEDVATELDIAQSTFSERLRLAEQRLLDLVFTGSESTSAGDADSQ
jgi:hypothetical protein